MKQDHELMIILGSYLLFRTLETQSLLILKRVKVFYQNLMTRLIFFRGMKRLEGLHFDYYLAIYALAKILRGCRRPG